MSDHDCHENEVEVGTSPNPNGSIKVWPECSVCHRVLGPVTYDSIL